MILQVDQSLSEDHGIILFYERFGQLLMKIDQAEGECSTQREIHEKGRELGHLMQHPLRAVPSLQVQLVLQISCLPIQIFL